MLSAEGRHDAGVLAINAASAALALSPIPCAGPVAAVCVAVRSGAAEVSAAGIPLLIATKKKGKAHRSLLVAATSHNTFGPCLLHSMFLSACDQPACLVLVRVLVWIEGNQHLAQVDPPAQQSDEPPTLRLLVAGTRERIVMLEAEVRTPHIRASSVLTSKRDGSYC